MAGGALQVKTDLAVRWLIVQDKETKTIVVTGTTRCITSGIGQSLAQVLLDVAEAAERKVASISLTLSH